MSSVIQQVEENFRRPLKGLKCTLLKRFYPQLPFASLSRSRHLPSSPRGEQLPHGAIEKHVAPENFPPYWRTKKMAGDRLGLHADPGPFTIKGNEVIARDRERSQRGLRSFSSHDDSIAHRASSPRRFNGCLTV